MSTFTNKPMIPLFKVFMSPTVDAEVLKTLHSGFITQGPKVEQYEEDLRKWFGLRHILSVNSGTSALELALDLAGVNAGDTVISTPMTCSATNTAIRSRQANIVWADIDPHLGNVTADTVTRAIEKSPTTPKAVMMVDWGGLPCDLSGVNAVAHKYGLKTIEDAAHAIGAKYHDAFVGAWSDYTAFSTQAIKHLTTVDGGLLMCKSAEDNRQGKLLRWFGLDRDGPKKSFRCELDLVRAGHKFHMNDVNATIGIENLKHLSTIVGKHRENAAFYYTQLQPLIAAGVLLMDRQTGYDSSHWLFTIRLPVGQRDPFEVFMGENGIQCSQVHSPNHTHTFARAFGPKYLPGVVTFSETQTNIPVGWWVTPEDRQYIVDTIYKFAETHL